MSRLFGEQVLKSFRAWVKLAVNNNGTSKMNWRVSKKQDLLYFIEIFENKRKKQIQISWHPQEQLHGVINEPHLYPCSKINRKKARMRPNIRSRIINGYVLYMPERK